MVMRRWSAQSCSSEVRFATLEVMDRNVSMRSGIAAPCAPFVVRGRVKNVVSLNEVKSVVFSNEERFHCTIVPAGKCAQIDTCCSHFSTTR